MGWLLRTMTHFSRSWLWFSRTSAIAALFLPAPCWGKGAVLWDQGVSLRFNEAGFLDQKDPGSFVPLEGSDWLRSIPNYLSGIKINGGHPVGSGVVVSRSSQTAEGRFAARGVQGRVTWALKRDEITCAVDLDWIGGLSVTPEGSQRHWRNSLSASTERTWKLTFSVPRPDRNPSAVQGSTAPEQPAPVSDPAGLIELDGPFIDKLAIALQAQMVGRSFQGGAPGSPPLCGPFSTTRRKYEGRVFWDADVWMLPSLLVLNPDAARRIAEFRFGQQGPAAAIAWSYAQSGFPRLETDGRRRGRFVPPVIQPVEVDSKMVRYPWESDRLGREAGKTESIFQEHINGSVCLGLQMASDWGLVSRSRVEILKRRAGAWYLARSTTLKGRGRSLLGVMSPDESSIVDNDLYTNSLAQWLTGQKFVRPRDSFSFLSFDNDKVRGYKQHAALLTLFPLQDQEAESQAEAMLNRFSGKASSEGPAMSLSLEALLWARQGKAEKAHQTWQASWSRHSQTGAFTERPKGGEDVFVTGAAGSLNAVIYGFAGMRLGRDKPQKAVWTRRLKSGAWLSFSPNLPPTWNQITFTQLLIDGVPHRLEVTQKGVLAIPRKVSRSTQPK